MYITSFFFFSGIYPLKSQKFFKSIKILIHFLQFAVLRKSPDFTDSKFPDFSLTYPRKCEFLTFLDFLDLAGNLWSYTNT